MSLFLFLSLAFELATGTLHASSSKTDHYLPISWLIQGPHSILTTITSLNTCKLLYILHFNSTRFNQTSILLALNAITLSFMAFLGLPYSVWDAPFSNKLLETNSVEFLLWRNWLQTFSIFVFCKYYFYLCS